MSHTPEPWKAVSRAGESTVDIKGTVTGCSFFSAAVAERVLYHDGHRIVACVNACAGMDDPAAEIERLRQIRAAAEAAGLIDEAGNFRLPKSALFRTMDGVIVRPGECVYVTGLRCKFAVDDDGTVAQQVLDGGQRRYMRVDECVSTKEAAQAAKEGKP